LPLVADEEERSVLPFVNARYGYGAPKNASELILAKRRDGFSGVIEEVLRVEDIVANEFEQRSVIVVGAGFGCNVNQSGGLAAEFGRVH
jgi:hypothetical protein